MTRSIVLIPTLLLLCIGSPAQAGILNRLFGATDDLSQVNSRLKGQVLDYTFNHGCDNRIWSEALGEKRDIYVYLPPGYDPKLQYPLMIFLHGIGNDERSFLKLVDLFDNAMACGEHVPTIIACPDGSISGRPVRLNAGSFYVNSKAGRFEDFTMQDIWGFLHQNFSIRPEREAHALIGGSMGGFGAYNLGIKHRDQVGVVAAIFPPLNLRYVDCHGRYFANFDPNCYGWRTQLQPWAPVGRYFGVITIRQRRLIEPLYGNPRHALNDIRRENPIEMLDDYDVKPGELDMYVAYVRKDEFNIDAQIESFLFLARGKGLTVTSVCMANGHHTLATGRKLTPGMISWLATRLEPFGPIAQPAKAELGVARTVPASPR